MTLMAPMLVEAEDYYWTMAGRGRLLYVNNLGQPWGLCTFFVLPTLDVTSYYPRAYWSTPQDLEDGPVVYVDKLVGHTMNLEIFRHIEAAVTQRVPNWHTAIWYRPSSQGPDRRYTYRRRYHGPNV